MKHWDERSEDVSKITPDKEKSRSLLRIISLREKRVNSSKPEEFCTLIVEDYYEIMMGAYHGNHVHRRMEDSQT